MPVAECLNHRYTALDELIDEISSLPRQGSGEECCEQIEDPGIKLMCNFWQILKEDPDVDLSQAVKQNMDVPKSSSIYSNPSVFLNEFACYMAANNSRNGRNVGGRGSGSSRGTEDARRDINRIREFCCGTQAQPSFSSRDCRITCGKEPPKSPRRFDNSLPLTKALCCLKEAASFDKKCNVRITNLLNTQKELKTQIQTLEQREKEGVKLLKEADAMWSKMEREYKDKIAASIERQNALIKQLRQVEASNGKWRKNKKELDSQLKNVIKSHQDITEKLQHKTNDIKSMESEIADYTKRIVTNKKTTDESNQILQNKKAASDKKIAKYNEDMKKIKTTLAEMTKHKQEKETEGKRIVQEARDVLQNINRVLMQKKLENEDLCAEKEELLKEIDFLKQTSELCKNKCEDKRKYIEDEIKKVEKNIDEYKYQCVQCHQCTDTNDARRLCSDCPKCKEERECITTGDHCNRDTTYDCVCFSIKEKLLSNVFGNMQTILERQCKSKPGKALADNIVNCLKNSRNGKLDKKTRDLVHIYVLNTVKKSLDLTIAGGAVKTRCEMDPDTYKQLMICLNLIKVENLVKEDKGTGPKKESCAHWDGSTECHCPGGAQNCICSKKAIQPANEPSSCPEGHQNMEDDVIVIECPKKESISCGPDCAMTLSASQPKNTTACKISNSCCTSDCPFSKNMETTQCVLGPSNYSLSKHYTRSTPIVPRVPDLDKLTCECDGTAKSTCKSCKCRKEATQLDTDHVIKCNNPHGEVLVNEYGKHIQEQIVKTKTNKTAHIDSKEIIKQNIDNVYVKLETDSAVFKIKSPVTKTISGNIALNITKLRGKIDLKNGDRPVFITKSESGSIVFDNNFDGFSNAILKNTPTGDLLLVFFDADEEHKENSSSPPFVGNLYTVTIENNHFGVIRVPAFLKLTPSNNYILIPDKEFENRVSNIMNSILTDKTEYEVNMTITDSENCVIRVDDTREEYKPNAVIKKTESGNVKVINLQKYVTTKHKIVSVVSSPKIINELIGSLPKNISTEPKNRSMALKRSAYLQTSSKSDSNVSPQEKLFGLNNKNEETERPTILKLTKSGQYAVILGKQSKTTFIRKVLDYLKKNNQGSIPIDKTENGDITIALNDDFSNNKDHYGCLKITPSGNLYVMVNKDIVEEINGFDDSASDSIEGTTEVNSRHIIKRLKNPVNKAVTTNCKGESCVDCDMSQCRCADLDISKYDWFYNPQHDNTTNFLEVAMKNNANNTNNLPLQMPQFLKSIRY